MVRRYPITAFYALLLALTWPIMIVAGDTVATDVALAVLGPSVCALIVAGVVGGRHAVTALLRRVLMWRAPWWAWFYAIVGNGVLLVGGAVVVVYLLGDGGLDWDVVPLVVTLALNLVILLVVPGLTEEIGWRGFALPQMQERSGPVIASLGVGVLWAAWHYPLIIVREGGVTLALLWFTIGVVGASFAYTWLHNATGGSVLLAIVLHAGENAWTGHAFANLFGDQHDLAFIARQLVAVAIAIVLVTVTKGALGRRRPTG